MKSQHHRVKQPHASTARNGSILIVVFVIVSILSLAAYRFSDRMLLEYQAQRLRVDAFQQRADAMSGVNLAIAKLSTRDNPLIGEDDTHWQWRGETGEVRIVSSLSDRKHLPLGLFDECAKLNLHSLSLEPNHRKQSLERLSKIPRMTPSLAAGILDWMSEKRRRAFAQLPPAEREREPLRTFSGWFDHLNDLLAVPGVTHELLFGEDANGNGMLDPAEDDGSLSLPNDNADGQLDQGWSNVLTVLSSEPRCNPYGQPLIDLNGNDLVELYDRLESVFGLETARFITAWRLAGSTEGVENQRIKTPNTLEDEAAVSRAERQLGTTNQATSLADLAKRGASSSVQRGGLNLSLGPAYRIDSVIDLVGIQVRLIIDGQDRILESPWPADPDSLERFLKTTAVHLTVYSAGHVPGRINVNRASKPVLETIPGMDPILLRRLLDAQRQAEVNPLIRQQRATLAWLIRERLLDLKRLRKLAPYINSAGTVFRGFALAEGQPDQRLVARRLLIDRGESRLRLLENTELLRLPLDKPLNLDRRVR